MEDTFYFSNTTWNGFPVTNWMSLAKSHASRAQMPLRSIHGGIIRWRFGEKNAFNRGSKWKMSCQVQRAGPYRGSFSNSSRYGKRGHDKKKKKRRKKREGKTFWLYSVLKWSWDRWHLILLKIKNRRFYRTREENTKLQAINDQYQYQYIAKICKFKSTSCVIWLYFVIEKKISLKEYYLKWNPQILK